MLHYLFFDDDCVSQANISVFYDGCTICGCSSVLLRLDLWFLNAMELRILLVGGGNYLLDHEGKNGLHWNLNE